MPLEDAISAYHAETNVEAPVTEDHSPFGYWTFGALAEIHKPQVWINRSDVERTAKLLAEYDLRNAQRRAEQKAAEPQTILVLCEECGQLAPFAGSLLGSVQDCPHCGAYVDVGEVDGADEVFGEPEGEVETGG